MFEKVIRSLKYDSNFFLVHKHIYIYIYEDTNTNHFTPLARCACGVIRKQRTAEITCAAKPPRNLFVCHSMCGGDCTTWGRCEFGGYLQFMPVTVCKGMLSDPYLSSQIHNIFVFVLSLVKCVCFLHEKSITLHSS